MTIPWLMNCSHMDDGWCLDCTKELGERVWKLEEELRDAHKEVARLLTTPGFILDDTTAGPSFELPAGDERSEK
jgi:hypothetical protein